MSGITCITCRVAFNNADLQRFHYKSDWHRYNLKRKVAGMPAITAEDFKQRVLSQQAQSEEKDTATFCKVCGKHFNCWNAYSNHLQSKKHKEAEAKASKKKVSEVAKENEKNLEKGLLESETGVKEEAASAQHSPGAGKKAEKGANLEGDVDDDGDWEDVEDEPIPATSCLFCGHSSEAIEGNVDHMTQEHSFFIPSIDYLVDPEGLLEYLGEKVGRGLMCLWCNSRSKMFFSVDSAQRHMRDKGHCKIQYEGSAALEYSDFYDFRSSYPDHEARADNDGDDGDSEEEEEEEVDVAALEQDGYELILPSGARIGHRELMRYYSQNLPPKRELVLKNSGVTKKLRNYYRAIGWNGASGDVNVRQVKDMRVIQKFRDRNRLKVGTNANGLQKHFRPQVIF